jgi:3-oxoacyl-[acyl-carrier-protein] synthase III
MARLKKNKTKKEIKKEDIFPILEVEQEGDYVIDGYQMHKEYTINQYFNDDLGVDPNDYEVEQEKYAIQSQDLQPIALDRYFRRIGKNRRTPR